MHNVCFKNYGDYTRWSFVTYDTQLTTNTFTCMNFEQVISKKKNIFSYAMLRYIICIYHDIFISLIYIYIKIYVRNYGKTSGVDW